MQFFFLIHPHFPFYQSNNIVYYTNFTAKRFSCQAVFAILKREEKDSNDKKLEGVDF